MPKFGELLPTDVWAAATRTLSAFAAQDLFLWPAIDSIYGGVTPASSGTADTFGDWVQISADVGSGKTLLGAIIQLNSLITPPGAEIEFGEGAAGAEAAITRALLSYGYITAEGFIAPIYVPLHRALTDNARLSVRARDSIAAAANWRVNVFVA